MASTLEYTDEAVDYIIAQCAKLSKWCEKPKKVTEKKLRRKWNKLFIDICQYMGIDNLSAIVLFEQLVLGNWEHIHLTEDEEKYTHSEWLAKFSSDIFYCSDRWSLDRLMRCHWLYRQIMRSFPKTN